MLKFSTDEFIVIGAMSESGASGLGDGMPWNVPEEYQHFVDAVRDQCVIIGRRSYEIFGGDFQAETLVVSKSAVFSGVTMCRSIEEAFEQARKLNRTTFVSGGRSIYKLGIPHATRMLLSTIKGGYEGDVYFPEFDESCWRVAAEEAHTRYILRDWRRS